MIIDLLTQKTTYFKVSSYDTLNRSMLHNGFSVKSIDDILSLEISDNEISSMELVFTSMDSVNVSEINYELIGGENSSNHIYKIYTSIDYINWYELPYKKDDKYIYKAIDNKLFNLDTKTFHDEDEFTNLTYAFTKFNEYTQTYDYLYNNLEFKYIKFVMSNLTASVNNPIKFLNFQILIHDELDLNYVNENILNIKSNMFYKQKVFEYENLYPDLIKNFLLMLEFNGTKNELSNLLTNHFYINSVDELLFLGNDIFGIDYDIIGYNLIVYPEE